MGLRPKAAGEQVGVPIANFDEVFRREIEDISTRRAKQPLRKPLPTGSEIYPSAQNGLNGLALSGGGVRSASFALGALQALDAAGVLDQIDYLSTVSGGGYIGTTLTTSMSTNGGKFPFGKDYDGKESDELRYIRDNSRYLIPNGLPTVISAFAVYLRGIAMNWLVVAPMIFAACVVLILFKALHDKAFASAASSGGGIAHSMPMTIYAAAVCAGLWMAYAIGVSVKRIPNLYHRQVLAAIFAAVVSLFAVLLLLELHLIVLDWLFQKDRVSLPYLSGVLKTIWAAAIAALPFVRTLGAWAQKGSGDSYAQFARRVFSSFILALIAAVVPLALWFAFMVVAHWGVKPEDAPGVLQWAWGAHPSWEKVCAFYFIAASVLVATWPFLSVNANSLHQLYRDRLSAAFLPTKPSPQPGVHAAMVPKKEGFLLSNLRSDFAPYHLLNAAINLPGAKVENQRGRNADFFIFSKNYVGSNLTGFVKTDWAEDVVDKLDIGTAMAISGAAAAPNMGIASIRPLSPTIALLNFRLGRWFEHPRSIVRRYDPSMKDASEKSKWVSLKSIPWPRYLLREAFFKSGLHLGVRKTDADADSNQFVFLTDGGHIENLGVFELLRRKCRLVIAIDAEADPEFEAPALTQLQRFARIDLGTKISMDWSEMRARARKTREEIAANTVQREHGPHVSLGRIEYPAARGSDTPEEGVLVYVKSSLSGDENDYVMKYARDHVRFPHEPTADQLFSEEQLEVYRALGEHIVQRFLSGEDVASCFPSDRQRLLKLLCTALPGKFSVRI